MICQKLRKTGSVLIVLIPHLFFVKQGYERSDLITLCLTIENCCSFYSFLFSFLSFFPIQMLVFDILCEKLVGNFILCFNCSISAIRFCIKCIYHLPRANIPRFYIVKGLPKRLIIYLCFLILLLLFNLGA